MGAAQCAFGRTGQPAVVGDAAAFADSRAIGSNLMDAQ